MGWFFTNRTACGTRDRLFRQFSPGLKPRDEEGSAEATQFSQEQMISAPCFVSPVAVSH